MTLPSTKRTGTWKKVTLWIGSILIVLMIGGYFVMNYAMNRFLDAMVPDLSETVVGEVAVDAGDDPSSDTGSNNSPDNGNAAAVQGGTQTDDMDAGEVDGGTGNNEQQISEQPIKDAPESNQENQPSENIVVDEGYSGAVDADKAGNVQEQVTAGEKLKISTVLLKRLGASDIQLLSELASGGMSVEEKVQAKKVILQKLTEEEYNELIAIAAKYGLSQGKSYNDSKKEDLN